MQIYYVTPSLILIIISRHTQQDFFITLLDLEKVVNTER